tara:strand:- start:1268 stop:1495 length:228 start_codon:yes stop_codon:yes gene_type:complete
MGPYNATTKDMDIRLWCHRNGIYVTPVQEGYRKRRWYVEITVNGKATKSPESYDHMNIWDKVMEYRKYYYNKYAK